MLLLMMCGGEGITIGALFHLLGGLGALLSFGILNHSLSKTVLLTLILGVYMTILGNFVYFDFDCAVSSEEGGKRTLWNFLTE